MEFNYIDTTSPAFIIAPSFFLIGMACLIWAAYLIKEHGFTPRNQLGGWVSIILAIISIMLMWMPLDSFIGFQFGILFAMFATAAGIASGFCGNERGYIGLGLTFMNIFWLLLVISFTSFYMT